MKHLIKKQEFLLAVHPGVEPFGVQHAASRCYRDKLLPILETVFDELSDEEEVIHIDRLVIDLGQIGEKSLETGFLYEEVYTAVKEELMKVIKGEREDAGIQREPLRLNVLAQWWQYMEKGRLPWNAGGVTEEWYGRVLETFSVDFGSVTRLRRALREYPVILQRVSYQHTDAFLETLTGIITGVRQAYLGKMAAAICIIGGWLEERYRKGIHDISWLRERRPGDGKEKLSDSLSSWATGHRQFLGSPVAHRKAIIWQMLLREAAESPGAFRTGGAARFLASWFTEDRLILRFLRTAGPGLPLFSFFFREGVDFADERTDADAIEGGLHGPDGVKPDRQREDKPKRIDKDEPGSSYEGETERSDKEEMRTSYEEVPGTSDKKDPESSYEDKAEPPDMDKIFQDIDAVFSNGQVDEDGVYCIHAGLILLHPFLSTLFSRLRLWDGGGFVDLAARQQALFLLHFLATGEREGREYDMVFPKMLCGYGLEMPLPGKMELPDIYFEEAEELLKMVLIRWDKLQNTSMAGLREGFLQRAGKLVNRNDRLILFVETSAIDLLLDYLPWNLGIVKLPWLKDILYVEWR